MLADCIGVVLVVGSTTCIAIYVFGADLSGISRQHAHGTSSINLDGTLSTRHAIEHYLLSSSNLFESV